MHKKINIYDICKHINTHIYTYISIYILYLCLSILKTDLCLELITKSYYQEKMSQIETFSKKKKKSQNQFENISPGGSQIQEFFFQVLNSLSFQFYIALVAKKIKEKEFILMLGLGNTVRHFVPEVKRVPTKVFLVGSTNLFSSATFISRF